MNKPGDRKHISTVAHQEEIAMSQELKEKTSQQQGNASVVQGLGEWGA
jgi:hypothetical protein